MICYDLAVTGQYWSSSDTLRHVYLVTTAHTIAYEAFSPQRVLSCLNIPTMDDSELVLVGFDGYLGIQNTICIHIFHLYNHKRYGYYSFLRSGNDECLNADFTWLLWRSGFLGAVGNYCGTAVIVWYIGLALRKDYGILSTYAELIVEGTSRIFVMQRHFSR